VASEGQKKGDRLSQKAVADVSQLAKDAWCFLQNAYEIKLCKSKDRAVKAVEIAKVKTRSLDAKPEVKVAHPNTEDRTQGFGGVNLK
jgi:hypothetical protein